MISKISWLSASFSLWVLGFVLGLIVGGVPLLTSRFSADAVDPFDLWVNYFVWAAGLFCSAMFIGFLRPERTWRWAIAVSLGLPAAESTEIIVDVAAGAVSHTLWPLTIVLTVFIAVPPAFAGAYLGAVTRRTYEILAKRDRKPNV